MPWHRFVRGGWIAAVVGVALVAIGCGSDEAAAPTSTIGDQGAASGPLETGSGHGTVVIGGIEFRFSATTCLVAEDLLAEGPGETDGRRFFVSVDGDGSVAVAFDVESGVDTPPEDAPHYKGLSAGGLARRGSSITGQATFVDANGDTAAEMAGSVEVTCDQ